MCCQRTEPAITEKGISKLFVKFTGYDRANGAN